MPTMPAVPPAPSLRRFTSRVWPATAGWLVPEENCTRLGYTIVLRAFCDIGIEEVPIGSNRGTRIDAMTKRAGLPVPKDARTNEGWYWCAIWAGIVLIDSGSVVPDHYPNCDAWLPYLEPPAYVPEPGDAVLYGLKKGFPFEQRTAWDAHHIGILARTVPAHRTIEGNRAFAGTASNNGQAVDYGPLVRRDVLGYFHPRPA